VLAVDIDPDLVTRAKEIKANCKVTFQTLDLMSEKAEGMLNSFLAEYDREAFDFVFCFSVTMWIHLNHGDQGLKDFCQKLAKYSSKALILEPQPWKCYRTAARRAVKLNQPEYGHLKTIAHARDRLEPFVVKVCEDNSLRLKGEFGATSWKRKILHFERQ